MRVYDVIQKKRDREPLDEAEIEFLIRGYTDGSVADYQMSAFAMAVYFNGMSPDELSWFTSAMLHSGDVLTLDEVAGTKVDKHSTGGVGDKISLPLAPAVAACGVPVPMISGRGLGHTGGTLDKLESIPGFNVNMTTADYRRLVRDVGCCLIGQTAELAPADKKLYALRDVTATVDCIPLIASSIMSKKLAEGIDALVLDVKYGSGAFMERLEDAETLARTMVGIGEKMGKQVVARMTNMDQPLGVMVGNALEVKESLDVLHGHGPADIIAITVELGAEMLHLGQVAATVEDGRQQMRAVLSDGRAARKFEQIIEAQGGDPRVVEDPSLLPATDKRVSVKAAKAGVVHAIDAREVGIASMLLGGGRARTDDVIDPRVGIEVHTRIGDAVRAGDELFVLQVGDKGVTDAVARLEACLRIEDAPLEPPSRFGARIDHAGSGPT